MKRVNFQNGTKTSEAKVTIDSTDYEVTPAVWTGTTPLSAYNLNKMQDNIEEEVNITQETQEASSVEITNIAGVNGKIDVSGNSIQATRSGKNLCSNSSINGDYLIFNIDNTKIEQTFKLSFITDVALSNNSIYLFINNGQIGYITNINGNANSKTTKTITLSDDYYNRVQNGTNVQLRVYKSNAGFTKLEEAQVENGTEATDYEEYGVSPSPDYPSEIHNVGDNVNLLNPEKVVTDSNNQNVYISNGYIRYVTGSNRLILKPTKIKANTAYTYKLVIKSGTTSTNYISFAAFYTDGTSESVFTSTNYADTNEHTIIFTTNANKTLDYVRSGHTDTQETFVKIEGSKIEKGTTATTYSPYNCGNANIKVQNRNLADESILASYKTSEDDECYIFKNNTLENIDIASNITFKENTSYTISYIAKQISGNPRLQIRYTDGTKENIMSGSGIATTLTKYTKVSDNSKTILAISSTRGGDANSPNFYIKKNSFLIEEGSTEANYIPHQEQTITFPLTEGQRLMLGDYLAEDGIHHVRGKMTFNGTEGWTKHNNVYTDFTRFQITKSDVKIWGKSLCSHFKDNNGTPAKNVCTIAQTNSLILLCVENDIATTVEELNTWLSNNNVNYEYELATEIIEPYTEEQEEAYWQLQHTPMYEGLTYVECIDEIKCKTIVEYYYNNELNKTYAGRIDRIDEEIYDIDERIDDLEKKEVYSTTEQIVGIWKGKPLYRKIVELSEAISLYTTIADIELPFTNISNMWICDKSTIVNSNNLTLPFPFANPADVISNQNGDVSGYIKIESGVPTLKIRKGQGTAVASESFVLEYTKTTD